MFRLAVELNLSKRRLFAARDAQRNESSDASRTGDVLQLGPQTYWEAVTHTLFGVLMFDGGDYPEHNQIIVQRMRELIDATEEIATYRETWCDTILFHTDDVPQCKTIKKADLWRETGNKQHWEAETKK